MDGSLARQESRYTEVRIALTGVDCLDDTRVPNARTAHSLYRLCRGIEKGSIFLRVDEFVCVCVDVCCVLVLVWVWVVGVVGRRVGKARRRDTRMLHKRKVPRKRDGQVEYQEEVMTARLEDPNTPYHLMDPETLIMHYQRHGFASTGH